MIPVYDSFSTNSKCVTKLLSNKVILQIVIEKNELLIVRE